MLKLIGLAHLSDRELLLLALVAACCCFAVGWIMDMIMERAGFGIIGNTIVALLGILVGLYAYANHYGSMTSPNIQMVAAFVIASVMLHLVGLSVVRRVLRL
jgi:uncharacterized membrane protein YeaQ/YmgE (transglycosylase-associated protein family)